MDVYVATSPAVFRNILEQKGFQIVWKRNHFSAMYFVPTGRYHILFLQQNRKVFCDFHFDNKLHGIGMGADYGKKPEAYFKKELQHMLDKKSIEYEISHVNWFTRRNKAIITGLRF